MNHECSKMKSKDHDAGMGDMQGHPSKLWGKEHRGREI